MVDLKQAHASLVQHGHGRHDRWTCWRSSAISLPSILARSADPDMALNNLDRFVAAARNPLAMGTLFERDPTALPTLLQIFSTSQHFSDLLVQRPGGFRPAAADRRGSRWRGRCWSRTWWPRSTALDHDQVVLRALRRFKRRETLRIAYGDIIREQSLETVTAQISYLADAILEAALRAAWRKLAPAAGHARAAPDGRPARFVVLGMGKLGGGELNYSSDIDLIFLYDGDGKTDGPRPITNAEFFDRLARELLRLLTEQTELGCAYRVDLRLRPDGQRGPMVASLPAALNYYDIRGRTWERQAYIKARPVAGDLDLGGEFLAQLTALDLPPLPEPGRHQRHQGPQAAHRAAEPRAAAATTATSRPATAASATSSSSSSFCNCSTAATCPPCAPATRWRPSPSWKSVGCLTQPGADAAGGQLHLPPQASSTACRSCSTCKRTCCPSERRRAAQAGLADGLRAIAGAARRWRPSLADYREQDRR